MEGGGQREEERRRTLRNFFAELISLMRPDHLTGGDSFSLLSPPPLLLPPPDRSRMHSIARIRRDTFCESYFCMHGYNSRKTRKEPNLRKYINVFTYAGPSWINRKRDACSPLEYHSGRLNYFTTELHRKMRLYRNFIWKRNKNLT